MSPQIKREALTSLAGFAALISISLLLAAPRLGEGLPLGVDSPSHFFKILYLYKTFTTYGYLPSWCSDWYGGTPFLQFYPPLTYLLTFLVALSGLGPLLAYKLVETIFYAAAPISVYFLGRELGLNKIQGLLAGFFFSLTPVVVENFIFYDRFTTTISVPFLCLFLIAFMRALKSKKLLPLISASFLLTILVLIHHLSAYYLGIIALLLAATQYLKTKDVKNIIWKTVFVFSASILLSFFWLYPFLSSTLSINNIFYNRSMTENFISPVTFMLTVFTLGISQLISANMEITFHVFPSAEDTKSHINTFRLVFPSGAIMVGSLISYWLLRVGQTLVILGFIVFFLSFLQSMKHKGGEEADFIFCVLWLMIFLWLGLGVYTLLIEALPFYEKLDTLRFTFYLAIPQSILAGKFFSRILSRLKGFSIRKINFGERQLLILAASLTLILLTNLYVVESSNFMQPKNFIIPEANVPREVVEFFDSAPSFARILAIRSPDWIYVLPYDTGKPIIDGWYPQEKLLKPLLEINDYQINTLNTYNKTDRVRVWSNLLGNASRLGINWVIIGKPEFNIVMANYTRFKAVQRIGNLTIYEASPPVSLAEISEEEAVGSLSISYSSPGNIILRVSDVARSVTVTIKEADFRGWRVLIDEKPAEHSRDDYGFITFQLEPGLNHTIRMEYAKQDFSLISLVTLLFLMAVLFAELTGLLKHMWLRLS